MSQSAPEYKIGQKVYDTWSNHTGIIKNIEFEPGEGVYGYEINTQIPNHFLSSSEDFLIPIDNLNLTQLEKDNLKSNREKIIKEYSERLPREFQAESKEFRNKFCYYCQCANGCNLCQPIK